MTDRFAAVAAAIDAARESAVSEAKSMIAGELAALQARFKRHRFGFFQGMGSHFVTIDPAFQGMEHLAPAEWGVDRFRSSQRFKAADDLVSAALRICNLADRLETEFHAQIGDLAPGDVAEQPAHGSEIAAAVAALGLSISAEFVPFSKSRNAKPGAAASEMSLNWKVTLRHNGRDVLTTDYGAGIAHCPSYRAPCHGAPHVMTLYRDQAIRAECETGKAYDFDQGQFFGAKKGTRPIEPNALDIVASLALDASALDHPTFESWAEDFGYDPDSRSAEKIYRLCLSHALALRNAIGDAALTELRDAAAEH